MFDSLDGTNLEYTLRLRHEVGTRNTWRTRDVADDVQTPGPRVSEKWVDKNGYYYVSIHNP